GDQIQGEGTWSLARGFMAAGSKRVVSSLWEVYDAAANTLINDFIDDVLKEDSQSVNYPELLKLAKLRIKEENPDPHYWG
ncbi:MAG: CHAT domain-containing protein, partial [Thermoguttaceae bacterium]|nr:CHAT domain-containing protein [Thermoguttaceae bacterium]